MFQPAFSSPFPLLCLLSSARECKEEEEAGIWIEVHPPCHQFAARSDCFSCSHEWAGPGAVDFFAFGTFIP